ncbi:permease prefix domain 1-containing protein [Protaetiibacter mangrovi]|uniref:Permease prefix domain 1-containing protein n=1 Tax=Protaetiibacter mangrovi TaxID=2970926 RepID=A0ABT1ZEV7_9MICO|nr:permease prefix domain 1-containing protein [Protaetiibacter mangrovi]MCS0499246.1 permease prefix domain 1-containing protein [Protaetiibacter mangrovi]TPX04154.1 hypothetical protein FJ656_13360 [Schumannella luteola]
MAAIHRLLDEAFAGIEPTPEALDLKDEIRANLEARVAELEAAGTEPDAAARRAIDELGDVRELVADLPATSPWNAHRVRPRPAFVVRTVLLSIVAAAALALLLLDGVGLLALPAGALAVAVAVVALALGVVVADALRQETSTDYPMSPRRASGYGLATAAVLGALGTGWLLLNGVELPWLALAGVLFLGGVALFAGLGASQTNRHKAWALQQSDHYAEQGDRFTRDPAAAARFGIYTLVIMVLAVVAFIVLTVTLGWAWSWLALVGGFLLMMIVLARMLFPPAR